MANICISEAELRQIVTEKSNSVVAIEKCNKDKLYLSIGISALRKEFCLSVDSCQDGILRTHIEPRLLVDIVSKFLTHSSMSAHSGGEVLIDTNMILEERLPNARIENVSIQQGSVSLDIKLC